MDAAARLAVRVCGKAGAVSDDLPRPGRAQRLPAFSADRHTLRGRWMDNDVYGHVNNVVYYSYFDTVANV